MRSSDESTAPSLIRDLARRLMLELTPEAQVRIAEAMAEVHELLAALNSLAARAQRLRASGRQHAQTQECDLPAGIPTCKPGDSFNLPGDLGGEFFETNPEAFFWGELGLEEAREELAGIAARLTRDLERADPSNAEQRAEELLARLPVSMLAVLGVRLEELES